jgi:LacI family transcriptional regulator
MKQDQPARRNVALLIHSATAHARGVLHGVARYARSLGCWSSFVHFRNNGVPAWLSGWKGDGIIARVETPEAARTLKRWRGPVIDVRGLFDLGIPVIETDDAAVARLAFEHFKERGFRHLAFAGFARVDFSERRLRAFAALVKEAHLPLHIYESPTPAGGDPTVAYDQHALRRTRAMQAWLRALPKPVGVFTCFDACGQQVLDACQEIGYGVPEEVAVLGVDDDAVFCDLANPPLSSIAGHIERIGYLAAQWLDHMMAGTGRPPSPLRVCPTKVIGRRSTDTFAVDDPEVAAALRFIRENAVKGIRVHDVVRGVALSRRSLERRFRELIGRSPHDEIMRVRLQCAQQLLRDTDLPLGTIARMTGFTYPEYLSAAFRRLTGLPPSQFRLDAGAPPSLPAP